MQAVAGQTYTHFPSDTGTIKPKYYLTKVEFISRKIFVNEFCINIYNKIEENKDSDYHLWYINNQIEGLRNTTAFLTTSHTHRNNIRKINMTGGEVYYRTDGSDSYIDAIILNNDVFDNDILKLRAPGLYTTTFDKKAREWDIEEKINDIQNSKKFFDIHHIAINGGADNALVAANVIPPHIVKGGQVTKGQLESRGYNMFYCPDEDGNDEGWQQLVKNFNEEDLELAKADMSKRIVALMEMYASYGEEASWTIQGSGDEIMTKALAYLSKKQPITPNKDLLDFSTQKIYFSNPANDMTKAKILVDELKLTYALENKLFDNSPFLFLNPKTEINNDIASGTNKVSAYSKPILGISGLAGKVLGASIAGGLEMAKLFESGMKEFNGASKSSLQARNLSRGGRRALAQVSCNDPQEASEQLKKINDMTKTMNVKMNTRFGYA